MKLKAFSLFTCYIIGIILCNILVVNGEAATESGARRRQPEVQSIALGKKKKKCKKKCKQKPKDGKKKCKKKCKQKEKKEKKKKEKKKKKKDKKKVGTRPKPKNPKTQPPTTSPSLHPSSPPTIKSSFVPSLDPTVPAPTNFPSFVPSAMPSDDPTIIPSTDPTSLPSLLPSQDPTSQSSPTPSVSKAPTVATPPPTPSPTPAPVTPTSPPTSVPTSPPTPAPTLVAITQSYEQSFVGDDSLTTMDTAQTADWEEQCATLLLTDDVTRIECDVTDQQVVDLSSNLLEESEAHRRLAAGTKKLLINYDVTSFSPTRTQAEEYHKTAVETVDANRVAFQSTLTTITGTTVTICNANAVGLEPSTAPSESNKPSVSIMPTTNECPLNRTTLVPSSMPSMEPSYVFEPSMVPSVLEPSTYPSLGLFNVTDVPSIEPTLSFAINGTIG